MTEPSRVSLSAQNLKAIAHPLRVRLLWLLRESGPSTATRLAEIIGQSSGVTSYHLRQLAQAGFVEEAEELGNARDRWWRSVHRGTSLDSPAIRDMPEEAEAYMRAIATLYAERVDRWLYELPSLPREWEHAATLSDTVLQLSPAESAELRSRAEALVAEYRRHDPDVEAPEGTETVVVQYQVMPFIGRAR